ncbi:MAG: hypothetical protein LBF54_03210 [Holosporaceae bacterium]|jgi:ribonuclease D|nr:hypothetical protein [Holosporaceae bacterium]
MFLVNTQGLLDDSLRVIGDELDNAPADERFISVDTEFIRENLKKPLLCLIQIATPSDVFIIDPIAVDVSPLDRVFGDSEIKKVFHSASQDLEMLSLCGIVTKNFYDTQLYEAILSTDSSISYQSIVSRYLDKKLEKVYSRSDWERRPLSKKQLKYSADDVSYLREVYKGQFRKLCELNRENWLDEELRRIMIKPNNDFSSTLGEHGLEIYNRLNEWRSEKAVEKDIPPESIAEDGIIKAICKKGVEFIQHIKNSRNVKNENHREFLRFAEKVAEGLEIKEKDNSRRVAINLLKTLLGICSQKHDVASSIIATSRDLEKLLEKDQNTKCLSGWRNEVFGKSAIKLLNGEISLRIDGTEVIAE